MRPWLKLVAASNTWHLDSTWYNSRSIPIPKGPAEEDICCPRHVPGKLWGSLSLLAPSLLCEESKPENGPGEIHAGGDAASRGWPERPCKLTVESSYHICKTGTPKVLRLSRDCRMKCQAGCLEEAAPRTSFIPPLRPWGFPPLDQGLVILRSHVVLCFSAQGTATRLIPTAQSGQGAGLGTPEGEADQDHW